MAVKIRLKRMGKIRAPFYRIIVADARTKRDGRVIEEIGTYNPKTDPSLISVDSERAQHWLSVGAQPSEPVRALLRKTGDWQRFRGEPAPAPLREPQPRAPRLEAFNAALHEAHGEPSGEAVTANTAAKKTARKTAKAAPTATEGDQSADDQTADVQTTGDQTTGTAEATSEDPPADAAEPADAKPAES